MIYHTYFLIFLILLLLSDLEKEVGENHVLYQISFLSGWVLQDSNKIFHDDLKNVLLMD